MAIATRTIIDKKNTPYQYIGLSFTTADPSMQIEHKRKKQEKTNVNAFITYILL